MNTEAIKAALESARDALAICYDVCEYPRNGETEQDKALAQVTEALSALSASAEQQPKAIEFIDHLINGVFEGADWDGGSLQDLAVQYGLLKKVEMQAPCSDEGCQCAQMEADFPAICYRKTYLNTSAPQASQPIKCKTCNGNDADVPCAYPSKGVQGCLRDKRLHVSQPSAWNEAIGAIEKLLPTLAEEECGFDEQGKHYCRPKDSVSIEDALIAIRALRQQAQAQTGEKTK